MSLEYMASQNGLYCNQTNYILYSQQWGKTYFFTCCRLWLGPQLFVAKVWFRFKFEHPGNMISTKVYMQLKLRNNINVLNSMEEQLDRRKHEMKNINKPAQ